MSAHEEDVDTPFEIGDEDEITTTENRDSSGNQPSERVPLAASSSQTDSQNDGESVQSGYQQQTRGYAQVSTHSDDEENEAEEAIPEDTLLGESELDPLRYPPAPAAYYRQDHPMRILHCWRLFLVLFAVGLACFAIAAVIDVSSPSDSFEPGRDQQSVADSVLAAMDRSADPCDNFYEYACGSWLRSSKIPPDRSGYTKSFSVLYDMIQRMLKVLLENDLQSSALPTPSKPGVYYASCIDQMGNGGLNTLYLDSFRTPFSNLNSAPSFAHLLAKIHTRSVIALFEVEVSVDEKKPSQYALYFGQGGLGLPHRDNYFSMKDSDVEMRRKYLQLLETLLNTAGKARLIPRRGNDLLAHLVLDFERELANITLPPEDLRDPEKSYNKVAISSLSADFSVPHYLKALGIDTTTIDGNIIIDNPPYFDKIASMMTKLNHDEAFRRTVRGYLAFHIVSSAAKLGLLGESMYHEQFKFHQLIYGTKQLPEQWKACQTHTNMFLGEAVGAAFVKKHFPEKRKEFARNLAGQISKAFESTLRSQTWMDDTTKKLAIEKLSAINWKVGYSSHLDTYDDVTVSHGSFRDNVASALDHMWRRKFTRLGKPIDRTEWFMDPQEVNAYYSPTRNEMVFPAAIFQQPFFSDAYPDAMNYGGIGAIIGHEMSHGFDDQGRKFDKTGMLRSWWSKASVDRYKEKTQCFIDLYDTYKPRDVDIHVIGNLTLGENLADTNGVKVAYHAFKSTGNNTQNGIPPPNPLLARELTNDQLFFVAYAQTWCSLSRPEALKIQMMTDPHSPGQFRVQGPLSQNVEFAKAFKCRNSSRYNPVNKCTLWQ